MSISLFYLANCPLHLETGPLLSTSIALDYCSALEPLFTEGDGFRCVDKEDLSLAVFHILTLLAKRVKHVYQSWKPDQAPTFNGVPFESLAVVQVLRSLVGYLEGSLINPYITQTLVLTYFL